MEIQVNRNREQINISGNAQQQATERTTRHYTMDQNTMNALKITELPDDEIVRAYLEEADRIHEKARAEGWKPLKLGKALFALNNRLVKEAKKAAKAKKKKERAAGKLAADQRISLRLHRDPVPVKPLNFTSGKFALDKESRKNLSALKRVEKKQNIKNLVEKDLTNPFLSNEMKGLLKEIKEYSEIRATASSLEFYRSKNFFYNLFSKNSWRSKKKALDREKELTASIREKITALLRTEKQGTLNYEMLKDYEKQLIEPSRGKLTLPEDPAKIVDYSQKEYKNVYCKVKERDKIVNGQKVLDNKGKVQQEEYVHRYELTLTDRSKEPLFPHEPCAKDVVQQGYGDCYFLASLSTVVSRYPEKIREMMKDEGNTVVVRFYKQTRDEKGNPIGTEPEYIRVSKKVSTEISAAESLWVQLMEKAYAVFVMKNQDERPGGGKGLAIQKETEKIAENPNEIDFGYMANGGSSRLAMDHLLGTESRQGNIILNRGKNYKEIIEAVNSAYTGNNHAKLMSYTTEIRKLKKQKEELRKVLKESVPEELKRNYERLSNEYDEAIESRTMSEEELNDLQKRRDDANDALEAARERAYAESDAMKDIEKRLNELNETRRKEAFEQDKGLYEREDVLRPNGECMVFIKEIFEDLKARKDASPEQYHKKTSIVKTKEDEYMQLMLQFNGQVEIFIQMIVQNDLNQQDADTNTMEKAKAYYQRVAAYLENFRTDQDCSAARSMPGLVQAVQRLVDISDEDATALIIKTAKLWVKELLDNFDTMFREGSETSFSGVYSSEAEDVYKQIKEAETNGLLMNAGTRDIKYDGERGHAGEHKAEGIASTHEYTVFGAETYKYNGKDIRFVKVRNPWAITTVVYTLNKKGEVVPKDSEERTDGVCLVELTQFIQRFDSVTFTDVNGKVGGVDNNRINVDDE